MTGEETDAMTALQELVRERQRYEGWLHALEARRGATPEHVYTRVQSDYAQRLQRVLERLAERTEQLREALEAATARLAALQGGERERADAREEAALRAAVGEYAPDEWARLRGEADEELARLATEREGVERELADLQHMMDEATRPAAPADGGATAAAADGARPADVAHEATRPGATASAVPASGSPAAPSAPAAGTGAGTGAPPSIDEFVAEWPVATATRGEGPTAGPDAATRGGAGPAGADARVGIMPQGSAGREASPANGSDPGGGARPAEDSRASGGGSGARPGAGGVLAGLGDRFRLPDSPAGDARRESEKTLACPECGAMNFATEWYCERCGGELSTF